jgi:hypothetical protein
MNYEDELLLRALESIVVALEEIREGLEWPVSEAVDFRVDDVKAAVKAVRTKLEEGSET